MARRVHEGEARPRTIGFDHGASTTPAFLIEDVCIVTERLHEVIASA
jgi:hypothetical protein